MWGRLWLVVTIFLRVAIIVRCRGCGVWVLTAFWGMLFQLAVSPFNWIDGMMEDVAQRVGVMLEREPPVRQQEKKLRSGAWRIFAGSSRGG